MSDYKKYRRTNVAEMRPYIPGEDISSVSVSKEDDPKAGDMIARNPANHADKWLVDAKYFKDNFEPLGAGGDTLAVKDMDTHHVALAQQWIDAQTKISALEAQLAAEREKVRVLREAAEAMRKDLLMRAEYDSKGVRVVACGSTVWRQFKEALQATAPGAGGGE